MVAECITIEAALTIQAGPIVKFKPKACLQTWGSGLIDADDSSDAAPIVFTSYRDDAHGGDTNQDGTSSSAAAGDWDGIQLSANGSSFNRVQVLYAGGGNRSALEIGSNCSATIRSSFFSQNRAGTGGITSPPALDASQAASETVITGNHFSGNTVPLSINTTFSLDDSNSFNEEPLNEFQAVVVKGCGHMESAIRWALTKVPLVIGNPRDACNYIVIDNGGLLAVGDNAILKFFNGGTIDVSGTLTADAATQIVFTSYRDDEHSGDTNADGPSAGAGGDWNGILLSANGSSFNRVQVLYAGGGNRSALEIGSNRSATIRSSFFSQNRAGTGAITSPPALDAPRPPARPSSPATTSPETPFRSRSRASLPFCRSTALGRSLRSR